MKSQKKSGILLSYLTLLLNSLFGILFTPFLIRSLGTSEFGVYQLVNSFAGYLIILNFGMSTIIARYVAKFQNEKDDDEQANFLFTAILIACCLFFVILLIGSLLFFGLDSLFSASLSVEELVKSKKLYMILVVNIALTVIMNISSGIIMGFEKFAVTNGLKLGRILIKYAVLLVLLNLGYKSIALVATDLFLTLLFILIESIYCIRVLKIKVKFKYFDKELVLSVTAFSFAIFLQTIVNQINQNLDRVILGSMMGTETVALYSISLVFLTTFSSLTGTIGGVFVPEATRMISRHATTEELTDFVIKPGRLQFMLGGAIVSGFVLLGENFITLWVGKQFLGAYIPAVILLVPSLIPLVQNVANAILDAKMKRMGRSVILIVMATINIVLTIILVNIIGFVGAAIGTAISIVIGNIILMNYYYKKVIGLNILRLFKEIFHGTFKCLVYTILILYPFVKMLPNNIFNFSLLIIIFLILYSLLLYRISFNAYEKSLFYAFYSKVP